MKIVLTKSQVCWLIETWVKDQFGAAGEPRGVYFLPASKDDPHHADFVSVICADGEPEGTGYVDYSETAETDITH